MPRKKKFSKKPRFQSALQTARELGISYRGLLDAIHTHDLRSLQLKEGQRSYLLDRIDVEAWIEARKTGSKRTAPSDKTRPNRTLAPYPSDWYVKKFEICR